MSLSSVRMAGVMQCQGTPGFFPSSCLCLESLQPELLRQVCDPGNPIVIEFQSMHHSNCLVFVILVPCLFIACLLDTDKLFSLIKFVPSQIKLWQKRSILPPPSWPIVQYIWRNCWQHSNQMDHIVSEQYTVDIDWEKDSNATRTLLTDQLQDQDPFLALACYVRS